MDYYEIGQRIRRYRKAMGLSQEQLAERVNISGTHMSHIETGNTKLSLPVLVALAQTLEVTTDELLFETPPDRRSAVVGEISEMMERCSAREARFLIELLRTARIAMEKHL